MVDDDLAAQYHLSFFRTDSHELRIGFTIVDSDNQVVVDSQDISLAAQAKHVDTPSRLLQPRPEAAPYVVTDSDKALGWHPLPVEPTRKLIGSAGAGRFNDVPEVVSYGDTGRPSYQTQHSTLRFGKDTLAQSRLFDHSRVTSWVASQSENCQAVGANTAPMTCSACFEMKNVTSCDTTLISAQSLQLRDDLLVTTFVPKDYSWPLKVKITELESHKVNEDTMCGEKLPQRYPELYVALTKLDTSAKAFDPKFAKVASESNGTAVVLFFTMFGCMVACLVGMCCIAWHCRNRPQPAEQSDDEGSTLFSARARG